MSSSNSKLICLICWLGIAAAYGLLSGGCQQEPGETIVDPVTPPNPVDTADTNTPDPPPDTNTTSEPADTVDLPKVDTLAFPGDCPPPSNRDTLDCPPRCHGELENVSHTLLNNPVYSPLDDCVYYEDSGVDSAYFAWFKRDPGNAMYHLEVPPGIYRLSLHDDRPAELVAPGGFHHSISPDGTTMYYVTAYWGGSIMKVRLPNGTPELVKDGCFARAFWYSADTLVVYTGLAWGLGTWFLDLQTDSLSQIRIHGTLDDVRCGKILTSRGGHLGLRDISGIEYFGPFANEVREGHWRPDGNEIVFRAFTPGNTEIHVTDFLGNIRILAFGGGPDQLCSGSIGEPAFASDGREILYIQHTTPIDYNPCCNSEQPVFDGQIWIMSAADGSGKRQVSTWSRIRP
jgi:hypothetical protein